MPDKSGILPDQDLCLETLRDNRWEKGLYCVHCESEKVAKNGRRNDGVQQYSCSSCGKCFNDRTGTVFSRTQMHLNECVYIIQQHQDQESVNQISKDLGRSWKTVNDFLKLVNHVIDPLELSEKIGQTRHSESLKVDYARISCGESNLE